MKKLTQYIIAALIVIPLITFLKYKQLQAEAQVSQKFVDEINLEMDRRDAELQPLIERNKKLNDQSQINPNVLMH